jgi:hypothetical protein
MKHLYILKMNKIIPRNIVNKYKKNISKCFKLYSKMYDVSLDNLPLSSLLSFIMTVIAVIFCCFHLNKIELSFHKYNINNNYKDHYTYILFIIICIHLLSFVHSLSISIIETIREWQFIKCKKCCRKYKKIIKSETFQHKYEIYQVIWGVIGTISLFTSYIIIVFSLIISSITTIIVYILKYSCQELSIKLDLFVNTSHAYIKKAKYQLKYANNVTDNIFSEYQKIVNLHEVYQESSLQTVNEIYTVSNEIEYNQNEIYQRRLLQQTFNPELEMAKGKNYLQILNQTIIYSENNIKHYIAYGRYYEEVCYDFGNLYDHFYYIFISFALLVISSYFIFANHYKYFCVYHYIINLAKNDIES